MKRTIIIKIILILSIFITIFTIKAEATENLNITLSKSEVGLQEEFEVTIGNKDIYAAAGTIWIFFDSDKLECISDDIENTNITENRVIYTWVSENGYNENLENLLSLTFKTKGEGTANFTVISEMYDESGNEIESDYIKKEILVKDEDASDSTDLATLRLNIEGIVPDFSPEITEYYLIVESDIEKINVNATARSSNSEIEISGNENLKDGLNQISIIVSNDGNNKEYVINVTKTDNTESANTNLETLAIENYYLTPEYQENVTNYTLEIDSIEETLNILAIPENMDAVVEIKNNENLQYGENQIEILVTAKNGITDRKYVLNVYKRSDEEQEVYEEEQKEIQQEANTIIQKISSGVYEDENEKDIEEENEKEELSNNIIMWVGIILSIVVTVLMITTIIKQKMRK